MLVLIAFNCHAIALEHFPVAQPTISKIDLIALLKTILPAHPHDKIVEFSLVVGRILVDTMARFMSWVIIVHSVLPFAISK